MLSVCIPSYNFDLTQLLNELIKQVDACDAPIEILVIDDASEDAYRKLNANISDRITYLQLQENVGRSRIRNRFLDEVNYEHLLFLDADSLVYSDRFLQNYIESIAANPKSVIVGGRVYPDTISEREKKLRWKYGVNRESKNAQMRSERPYNSFMTCNFIVPLSILESIRFDERIRNYGHEDTLFGIELKEKGVEIKHIENPILNGDVENSEVFLHKTEQGIENLVHILSFRNFDRNFIDAVTVLRVFKRIVGISWCIKSLFKLTQRLIQRNLKSNNPSIRLFNFYKLALLNEVVRKKGLLKELKRA